MTVVKSKEGSVAILKPMGPIVADEMDDLVEDLESTVESGNLAVAIDLREVPFIDSAGLELLTKVQRTLQRMGGALKLVGPTSLCRQILEVTRLIDAFEVHTDSMSAVRSFL